MYGLRINNIYVPLDAGAGAAMDRYSSLFADEVKGEYTFAFDIPITNEWKQATQHIDWESSDLSVILYEFDCIIVDGGIERYHDVRLKVLGRKGNRMQCNVRIGESSIASYLRHTKLTSLDLGTVVLNADEPTKFVQFELHQPGTGGSATTGSFGVSVNGTFTGVPFNTDLPTTMQDFVTAYNTTYSAVNGNTASYVATNKIKFTANEAGGGWPFDYSDSITDAEVPENASDVCTLTLDDVFDAANYAQDNAQGAYTETVSGSTVKFPVVKNPKFNSDADGLANGDYGGYLNYQVAGATTLKANNGTTDLWKYHLLPLVMVKHVIETMYEAEGFTVSGDFLTDAETSTLLIYNNRAIDESWTDDGGVTSWNVYKNSVVVNEHVPDITCEALLMALMKRFNLYRITDAELMTVTIGFGNTVLGTTTSEDYTEMMDDTQEFDMPEVKGLTLKLAQDSTDDLYELHIKKTTGHNILDAVATIEDLPDLASNWDLCYVNELNQYYIYRGATWGLYSELQDDVTVDDGSTEIDCGLGTLFTRREADVLDSGRSWIVPYAMQVGVTLAPDAQANDTAYTLRILFYRGVVEDGEGEDYFLAQGFAYAMNESFDRAVHWNTAKGGFEVDYKKKYRFLKYARVVYKDVILPLDRQLNYVETDWIYAHGNRYLPKRVTFALPFKQKVRMELLQHNYDGEDPNYILTESGIIITTESGEGLVVE